MGQAQREAIEAPGYVAVPRVATIALHDPLVGPFPKKKSSLVTRLVDVIGAVALLVFTAPLIFVLALLVKLYDGGPVIFVHRRIGHGGNMFPCLKIRTMVMDADKRLDQLLATDANARAEWALDQKLRNDPRITGLGRFLRRSSLDELPQLINVLRGDMSLVGPRPIVLDEAPRYGHAIAEYQAMKPGITGLWQVSGRSDATYTERVRMDVQYV